MQLLLTLIFYGLMVGILVFVGLMWHESVRRRIRLDAAMLEVVKLSSESTRAAAESARDAAEAAKRLSAFLGSEHHA